MAFRGLLTADVWLAALIVAPFFASTIWLRERRFAGTSNRRYTQAALAICAAAAIVGLPIW